MDQERMESDPKDPHPILQMENVTFQYRQAEGKALESLSLKIHRGETVVIMGRSGCGKSTLCYTLNGLIPHFLIGRFSGKVSIQGRDTLTQPVWRQAGTVGLVFQDFETQLVSTNVEMELAHTLEQLDAPLTQEQMAQRIQRALEQVGLAGLQRRDPLSLSGGQQQRLVIASLLVREPSLLVLDQPMTDLDPLTRSQLVALFQGLKQQGMTMVLAEPESEDVLHADRIYLLEKGQVKWQGPPPALFRQPDVAKECGIRPLPLTECFRDLGLPNLPITVEEAWKLCDEHSLTLASSASHTPHETPSPLMGEGWGGGENSR
jgi:energy-coupling factor transport system ATP-binding protein